MGWPSLSDIGNSVSNGWRATRDAVSDTASSAVDTVSSAASSAASTVSRTATAVSSAASDLGAAARDRAVDLGRAGLDLGRRGVEAVQNFDVREAAATARDGIAKGTEAARNGVNTATDWSAARVGDAADWARSNVDGDGLASQAFRGAVTAVENNARFGLGVTGGITREVVSTVGAVGQLTVTAAEVQASPEAAREYGTAIANTLGDAGRATGDYLSSVADDPSRLAGDAQGAWDATSGFVGDTADRYGQAIREGRMEEIGKDVGTVATYIAPVGGGPVRGALTATVRGGAEVAVREGGEALVRTAAGGVAREGGEAAVRTTAEAAVTRGGTELAERRGAELVQRLTEAGGTTTLPNGAGRIADLSAASRQSGVELAVFRDGTTGQRMVTMGAAESVSVPAGSRIIAHTQPGAGAAALTPSATDLAGLGALGQRSSAIIDQAGGLARFGVDDATLATTPRAAAGEAVTFRAPEGMTGPVTFRPPPGATAEEVAQVKAYIEGSNAALDAGALSSTGRVSTKGDLRTDASLAAAQERARAANAGTPYQGHAGHVPDTTWTGTAQPHSWLDLSPRVNTSLGGQVGGYPLGYKPTEFLFEGP